MTKLIDALARESDKRNELEYRAGLLLGGFFASVAIVAAVLGGYAYLGGSGPEETGLFALLAVALAAIAGLLLRGAWAFRPATVSTASLASAGWRVLEAILIVGAAGFLIAVVDNPAWDAYFGLIMLCAAGPLSGAWSTLQYQRPAER